MAKATKAPEYTIIRDTREQQGYHFKPYNLCVGMEDLKLDTGDYTIKGLEDKICVERKASVTELALNLGQDKHRFMNEIQRMKHFPHRYLVLEFSMADISKFPEGTKVRKDSLRKGSKNPLKITGKYMLRCLMEFEIFDDINVVFCGDKYNGFMYVSSLFKRVNEKYSIGRGQ